MKSSHVDMFDKLKKIQENIEKAQKQLELREFVSRIGDITIVMQGTKQVIDVRIQSLPQNANLDNIQESILLSFNDALRQIEEASEELFAKASQEYDF